MVPGQEPFGKEVCQLIRVRQAFIKWSTARQQSLLAGRVEGSAGDKPKVLDGEVLQLRKNGVEVRCTDAKPPRERGRVLIDRSCWYPPAAGIGVIRTAQFKSGKNGTVRPGHAVEVTAKNGSSHDQMIITPRVVGTHRSRRPCWLERPAKIRKRERDDLGVHLKFNRSIVERFHGLTDLCQKRGLRIYLTLVGIKTTQ